MNKEQLYETIEAYLEGKLEAEACHAFEREMADDPELRAEVALHKKMQEELGRSGKAALREQLRQIGQEFPLEKKGRRAISWLMPVSVALAASIIGAVIWWAWPRFGQPTLPQGPSVVVDSLPGEQKVSPDSLIAVEPQPEEAVPSRPEKQPPALQPSSGPYLPNPQLEALAASEGRDVNFLISAEAGAVKTGSEHFRATVAGTLRAGSPVGEGRIVLQIYDNRPDSYRKERPASSLPLELQPLEDEEVQGFGRMKNYTFEKEVEKELPPGLYYYVIKREGEDTPLFVGKVEVRKED